MGNKQILLAGLVLLQNTVYSKFHGPYLISSSTLKNNLTKSQIDTNLINAEYEIPKIDGNNLTLKDSDIR